MQLIIYPLFLCLVISTVFGLDANWRLLWSDEFSASTLDSAKWNVRSEPGNYGNEELQTYVPSQVSFADGSLVLTAAINNTGVNPTYVSGKVDSKDKFYTTYGRYEIRAKVPAGAGLWPAIWLLSQTLCWPVGMEIDIMEFIGSQPFATQGNFHYGPCCGCNIIKGAILNTTTSVADDFHVFAVEWNTTAITWFFDDMAFFSIPSAEHDASPHYVILNLAVGGKFPGNPDASTPFPSSLYIDYVRVYVWKPSCDAANVCSSHGCCLPYNVTCLCDAGWAGSSCEYSTGNITHDLNVFDPEQDYIVHGWGNGFSFFSSDNVKFDPELTLVVSDVACPTVCGGLNYSSGAWTSLKDYPYGTFTFTAKASNLPGTALSLVAESLTRPLNQISLVITGVAPTALTISTTVNDVYYWQAYADLPFDASQGFHTYSFFYTAGSVLFYADGTRIANITANVPSGRFSFGIYYAANPLWYGGGPFVLPANSSVSIREVDWQIVPKFASCPCNVSKPNFQETFARNFTQLDGSMDSLVNGWGNGFSLYLSPNAEIGNQILSLSLDQCSHCGEMNYSAAGWMSQSYFAYGKYTYAAQSTHVSGTALTLGAVGNGNGEEQIVFVLGGGTPSSVSATSWNAGVYYQHGTFDLPFDASLGMHNYSFLFTRTAIVFEIDGIKYFTATSGIPKGPLAFASYYAAQPAWYGAFEFTGKSSALISRVTFSSVDVCYNPLEVATTTAASAGSTTTGDITTGVSSASSTATSAGGDTTSDITTGDASTTTGSGVVGTTTGDDAGSSTGGDVPLGTTTAVDPIGSANSLSVCVYLFVLVLVVLM